jgi:hypothetical protein
MEPCSQVFMNSGTHKRSITNEYGNEELNHVQKGNVLATRCRWDGLLALEHMFFGDVCLRCMCTFAALARRHARMSTHVETAHAQCVGVYVHESV